MAGILTKMISGRYILPFSVMKLRNNQVEQNQLRTITKCLQKTPTLPFGLISRAASSFMKCEKDDYTNRCGLNLMTKPPCCAMPNTSDKKKKKYGRQIKEPDEFDENCAAGRAGKSPCSDQHRIGYKKKKTLTPIELLHYKKECCPCLPDMPRFDELYYKIIKLNERCIKRSWTECPKPRIIPKLVCCHENEPFEFPRRPKCHRPPTACTFEVLTDKLKICNKGGNPNCVKINSPCCCPARNPPKCIRRSKSLCTERLKNPAPSFSECRIKVKPLKPSECRCLDKIYACELNFLVDYNEHC